MKKLFVAILSGMMVAVAAAAFLLFAAKSNGGGQTVTVGKGQGFSAVSKQLDEKGLVYSRAVLQIAAALSGRPKTLYAGTHKLPEQFSAWEVLSVLEQRPPAITVRIIEGMTFAQMRDAVNKHPDLAHDSADWSQEKLLKTVAPDAPSANPEGLFFPDSYRADAGSSDIQIYQAAYRKMQQHLNAAWDGRQAGLPYKNPYELLIMASIVEKETAHPDDRRHVAAVFRNRLHKNMRLQTDPTVIYGMGAAYQGNIRRSDLERDTPYNTYTRAGLTPTPIALPGKAALEAAANPSDADYIYFVAKMDGSGKSQFSRTLDEHNAAVRKYILKK